MNCTVLPNVVPLTIDPSTPLLFDQRKLGWKMGQAHPKLSPPEFPQGCLAVGLTKVIGPRDEKQFLRGADLFERAHQRKALFGQRHAEALYTERNILLKPWRRKGRIIVCPREVWIDTKGHLRVSTLVFTRNGWIFEFLLYENAWRDEYLLVLLDKEAKADKNKDAAVSIH